MNDLTKGRPIKVLILFAIPLLIGYVFQQFYSLVDTMIVGHYLGYESLAAVGATSAITSLIIGFINGMTNGFAIVIAKYFGAKNQEKMKKAIAGTILLSFLLTIFMMGVSAAFIMKLLVLLGTPNSIIEQSYRYIIIIILGMIFTTFYNAQASILRAVGNTVMPLVFLVVSAIINVGLDVAFVTVFGWGVVGAAVATIMAQAISGLCCFIYIVTCCKEIVVSPSDFNLSSSMVGELIIQGLSMGFMSSFVSIGSVILQSAINGFGDTIIAAHTTARKIFEICDIPLFVMAMSSATYCSQNMGAGRFDRVKKGLIEVCVATSIWSVFTFAVTWLFAPFLIAAVSGTTNPEVVGMGAMYIKIASCCYIILGILLVMRNAMQGIGYNWPPVATSAIELLAKVASVLFVTPRLGYFGVMMTEPVIWIVCGVLLIILFVAGSKKYQEIADKNRKKIEESQDLGIHV